MWEEFYRTLKNTLILEADEEGISRWEDMLGIIPMGSLEDRRLKVFLEWNSTVIWTDRTLRQFLDLFIGKGAYDLEFVYDKYALNIKLFLEKRQVSTDNLLREMRAIIPANIAMFTTINIAFREIWAGGRRRALHLKYGMHQPTGIDGKNEQIFAGRLVNTFIKSYIINGASSNLRSKGEDGYLMSDLGQIKGVIVNE